jgi:Fic/DOC family
VPRTVERTWEGDSGAMGGRQARASFRYQAFVPDEIAVLSPVVPFEVADLSADAETAIRALNERASVGGLEAIGPLLLRSEAEASSRIEGYDVSSLNLARALIDPRAARGSARIVAANVSAMEEAIAIGDRTKPVTVADLLAIHAVLMAGDERARPGRLREEQNWIGGRLGNPSDAAFVPPPEDLVLPLLEDLVAFVARDDLPAVAQAAVAHAQFETIHPFIDGNGRVGRALIHVVLRRRGVAGSSRRSASSWRPGPPRTSRGSRPSARAALPSGLARSPRQPSERPPRRSSSPTRWPRSRASGVSALAARGPDPRRASSSRCSLRCRCCPRRPPARRSASASNRRSRRSRPWPWPASSAS